jgi:hypothetical protein
MSVRRAGAWHGQDVDTVVRFEQSDLPERHKAALRLAAAFLGAPTGLTAEARTAALEHFTPDEIVGMLLKLTALSWNKVRVSLGVDAPAGEDALTLFQYGEDGVAFLL